MSDFGLVWETKYVYFPKAPSEDVADRFLLLVVYHPCEVKTIRPSVKSISSAPLENAVLVVLCERKSNDVCYTAWDVRGGIREIYNGVSKRSLYEVLEGIYGEFCTREVMGYLW